MFTWPFRKYSMPHLGPKQYGGTSLEGVLRASSESTVFSVWWYQWIAARSESLTLRTDSVKYLPTTVATVFTFLTPIIGPWLSFFYIGDPFPLHEQLAGASSLIGVFIVAFGETGATQEPPATNFTLSGPTNSTCELHPDDASCQLAMVPNGRVLAMAIALFGVLGAAVAYALIRKIGNRAHSLIIVNYLSDMATVLSFVILLLSKGIQLPSSISQGFCLVALGLCGFTSQFLLTMGFQEAETSAAALMIYTQLLFAMAFDWLLWRTFPGWSEWLGCCIIIGSAAFVAIKRTRTMILVAEPDKADDEVEEHLMNDFGASNSEGFDTTRRHSTTRRSHSE